MLSNARARFIAIGSVIGVVSVLLVGTSATASGPGFGDVSSAMIYGPSGPIGLPIPGLVNQDDKSVVIPAPFPVNFFGTKYDFLCVSINGTISPMLTASSLCSDRYDKDLNNLALENNAPVIAPLALDLNATRPLWLPPVAASTVSLTNNVVTVTTSAPHGLVAGGTAFMWFPAGLTGISGEQARLVTAVVSPTQFTYSESGADRPSTPTPGGTVSTGVYDSTGNDGFGQVKRIYQGTTVVDGKQAVVITWYRVPNYEQANSKALSNTFQVVLIQEPTANALAVGSDFTIQFNYGTLTDNSDGYRGSAPNNSCSSGTVVDIADCRWGVGWANWTAGSPPTTAVFELFPTTEINRLVDSGGVTAIVNNRLNSTVNGRYTFKMIAGVTVGFAQPVLNGSNSGPLPVFTSAAPAGSIVAGVPFTVPVTASGTGPITFAVSAGSLPPGLTLNSSTGVISGTPTTAGAYTFTVTATNAVGSASVTYSQNVTAPAATVPAFTSPAPAASIVAGRPYTVTVTASGSTPTYAVTAGSLPLGLTLNSSTGVISGTPTTPGAYTFTITATNVAGAASVTYSQRVTAAVRLPIVSG